MNFIKREWFRLSVLLISVIVITIIFYNFTKSQDKVYIAKRKNDCFNIYDKEKNNWDNALSSQYDVDKDSCFVVYKDDNNYKTEPECEKLAQKNNKFDPIVYKSCINKTFKREF